MIYSIFILGIIGLGISLYGIIVERRLQVNKDYKAVCDISDKVSCTKPFLSSYAKIFGISNILLSLAYYSVIIVLSVFEYSNLLLLISFCGVIVSVIFAYILYFKIQSFCLICNALYLINIGIFIFSL